MNNVLFTGRWQCSMLTGETISAHWAAVSRTIFCAIFELIWAKHGFFFNKSSIICYRSILILCFLFLLQYILNYTCRILHFTGKDENIYLKYLYTHADIFKIVFLYVTIPIKNYNIIITLYNVILKSIFNIIIISNNIDNKSSIIITHLHATFSLNF